MKTPALAAFLYPWKHAGLEYVLAETDVPPEWSLCGDAAATAARPRRKRGAAAVPPLPGPRPAERDAVSRSGGRERRVSGERPVPASGAESAVPPSARENTPRTSETSVPPSGREEASRTGAPARTVPLPPAWQQRLAATRPGVVLWTYRALGADLCATPDARRRALFQRLLTELGHRAGTHCFWPVALPDPASGEEDGLSAHTDAFWHGVNVLGCRALVVLGSRALQALRLPRRLRPFQQARIDGRMIIVLPDADMLIQEPHRYTAVREYLRQALAPYARR